MSTAEQDKQRSELLKKQLSQMGEDFDFMKKSREEWKKQLDARFQDIDRYFDHYSGKSKVVSSISPTKQREPMIPS
jgi:thiamine biosynthesis lipoprotein ApbE